MRYTAFCTVLLVISEPLLSHANKVLVVVPQQIRRSPLPPWRPAPSRYRKSSHSNEIHYHRHHAPGHGKKSVYASPPFPHGGDDFDQGHEHVNHVNIPYGKDVSHAISFGKGYVPYDQIKGTFSLGRERYPGPQEHRLSEPEYAPSSFSPSDSEYPSPEQSYEATQSGTYFADPQSALNVFSERNNDLKKFYTSRSIEKDLAANVDLSGAIDREKQQLFLQANVPQQPQGLVVLPSGIPSPTIAGSKQGVVLRDTVSLDAYQQKLQEMTKSWPQFLPAANGGYQSQQGQQTTSFSTAVSPGSSFTGSYSWPLNFAQPKQGYAVKEDTMEPPHDFRTMPIQASPFQTVPAPVNLAFPGLSQAIRA